MSQGILFAKGDAKQRERARERLLRIIDGFMPLTRAWMVEVREYRRKRSDAQNRYLFGVPYRMIADATGYTADEVHELLAHKFLPAGEVKIGDVIVTKRRSTATLDAIEFGQYVDHVAMFAAQELGIVIPPPSLDHLEAA